MVLTTILLAYAQVIYNGNNAAGARLYEILDNVKARGVGRPRDNHCHEGPGVCPALTPFEDARTMANRGCGGPRNGDPGLRRPTAAFLPGQMITVRWRHGDVPYVVTGAPDYRLVPSFRMSDLNDTGVRIAIHYAPDDSFSANILAGGVSGDPPFEVVSAASNLEDPSWPWRVNMMDPSWPLASVTVRLPRGKTCTFCTLQWVWAVRGRHVDWDRQTSSRTPDLNNNYDGGVYIDCMDISITADGQLPSDDQLNALVAAPLSPDLDQRLADLSYVLYGLPMWWSPPAPPPPPPVITYGDPNGISGSIEKRHESDDRLDFEAKLLRENEVCSGDVINYCGHPEAHPEGCDLRDCARYSAQYVRYDFSVEDPAEGTRSGTKVVGYFMHQPNIGGCAALPSWRANCDGGFVPRVGAHFYRVEVELEEEVRLQERNNNPYTYGQCHAFGRGWGIMGINADVFYMWLGIIFAFAVFLLLLISWHDDCIHDRAARTHLRTFAIGLYVGSTLLAFAVGRCGLRLWSFFNAAMWALPCVCFCFRACETAYDLRQRGQPLTMRTVVLGSRTAADVQLQDAVQTTRLGALSPPFTLNVQSPPPTLNAPQPTESAV